MSLYRSATAIIMLLAGSLALSADTPDKLKKLTPDPMIVFLDDGIGTARLTFLVQPKTPKPRIVIQDAVSSSNAIPRANIRFEYSEEPWETAQQVLWEAEIKVGTQTYVDPAAEYKGRVVFFWPDGALAISDFTIKDRHATDFTVSASSLDVALGPGQPTKVTFNLTNSGKSVIRDLAISSLGLVDSSTRHRVSSFQTSSAQIGAAPIAPGEEKLVSLQLPIPRLAGTYQGELEVLVNGGKVRKAISLKLQVRGPNGLFSSQSLSWQSNWLRLPFVLFMLVLIVGAALATIFEDWFAGGGLQHVEAVLSLQRSLAALKGFSKRIDEWEKAHAGANCLPRTKTDLTLYSAELDRLLSGASDIPSPDLASAAQRFAVRVPFFDSLWDAVRAATTKWTDPQKQTDVIRKLDQESAADLNAYREALRQILEKEETDITARQAWRGTLRRELLPPKARLQVFGRNLQAKVHWMAWLYRTVVWILVFFTAYLTFYANKFAFGTVQDYFGVFIWALGLTPTGAQLLARARGSQTRSP
jgi:hypothetical protein